jgi:hypothetical protein
MRLLWRLVISNALGILAFLLVLVVGTELLSGWGRFSLLLAIPLSIVCGVGAFLSSFALLLRER